MQTDSEDARANHALIVALIKAKQAFGNVSKDKTNPHFRSKYADLAAYIEATEKALCDNGLVVVQSPGAFLDGQIMLTTTLMHVDGGAIGSTLSNPCKQPDAQGYGSCLTYARRYAYAAILGLVADDDDGETAVRPAERKPEAKPEAKATPEEYVANTYYGGSLEDVAEWAKNVKCDGKIIRAFASWHFKNRPNGTDLGTHFQQFKAEQEAKV